MNKLINYLLIGTLIFFCFFVFFDLNWGSPYYFHPDERNIASAVTRLNLFQNLNPDFFAYGGLPIYSIYLVGLFDNYLQSPFSFKDFSVSFENAIVISRLFSSILTLFTVFLIYKCSRFFMSDIASKLAVILSSLSVSYLQYSHFGTFEIWLSFVYILLFFTTLIFLRKENLKSFLIVSLVFALGISIKISSIVLILLPITALFITSLRQKKFYWKVFRSIRYILILSYVSIITFLLANPFSILDMDSFINSINYETSVATGSLHVFYTGSFNETLPIYYQVTKVLPFLINPVLTIVLIFSLLYIILITYKRKNKYLLLLLVAFFAVFLSQSILYVKWTRYLVPSIAFIYLLITFVVFEIKDKINVKAWNSLVVLIVLISLIYSASFIKTVRFTKDSRLEAAEFANENIERDSIIASEVYDLGIVPFNENFDNITLFDFYELDNNPNESSKTIVDTIKDSDYIILPSQRLLKSRTENTDKFPVAGKFYSELKGGKSSFINMYKTKCDIFCKIIYLGDPIYNVEETANIFDRPIVQIYKNDKITR